jgi:1,4-alpha-glucan branching enzyme
MAEAQKKPRARKAAEPRPGPELDAGDLQRLIAGEHPSPHSVLGAHPATVDRATGVILRAMMPDAVQVDCLLADGRAEPMTRDAEGRVNLFSVFLRGAVLPLRYRWRFHFPDASVWEREDPYRFLPTLGDVDLHLFNEGTHRELWKKLGAHPREMDGISGVSFAVWAPNAQRVSVVGDFCRWDGRVYPMRMLGSSGVWEIFLPEVASGTLYKFELLTREGQVRIKTDPFAFKMEQFPGTASIVEAESRSQWGDPVSVGRRRLGRRASRARPAPLAHEYL